MISLYISVVMPANGLRVNHYNFEALHSMWRNSLAPVSYLRSLVVRAVHRHRTGVGSIPSGGPIVDDFSQLFSVRISICVQLPLVLTLRNLFPYS